MPKNVVEYIVKSLVEKPDQVRVVEKNENSKVLLEIHVDSDDLGKVIGRAGKTIRSIRAIVGLVFSNQDLLVDVAR